jgi:hypothetical protein
MGTRRNTCFCAVIYVEFQARYPAAESGIMDCVSVEKA